MLTETNKKRKVEEVDPAPAPGAIVPMPSAIVSNPYQHLEPATGSNAVDSSTLDLVLASNNEQRIVAVAERKKELKERKKKFDGKERKGIFKATVRNKHSERQQDMKDRGRQKREQMLEKKRKGDGNSNTNTPTEDIEGVPEQA